MNDQVLPVAICPICSFQAKSEGYLRTHTMKKHKQKVEGIERQILEVMCATCGFATKSQKVLDEHFIEKHRQTERMETKPQGEYATKDEFKSLEDKMQTLMGMVEKAFESLEKKAEVKTEVASEEKKSGTQMPVPPQWAKIAEDLFSSEIAKSMRISYPLIRITIPNEISNAPKDHLEFYRKDVRTMVLKSGDGEANIRLWLERVKRNLDKK